MAPCLQIHDARPEGRLAFDLSDILTALGKRAVSAYWAVGGVASYDEPLDATGPGASHLERLAQSGERVTGAHLARIASVVRQVIWGEFRGYPDRSSNEAWVVIAAIDSSWFDVRSDDEAALGRIRHAFKDVRSPQGSGKQH
jgi:hypothetical protein